MHVPDGGFQLLLSHIADACILICNGRKICLPLGEIVNILAAPEATEASLNGCGFAVKVCLFHQRDM